MLFGKLMLQRPNVLVMDEPTNHLDMESIESLNTALENYPGTLIFVSHDREFVSSLATRIIEITAKGIVNFGGSYDDYLHSQGVETACGENTLPVSPLRYSVIQQLAAESVLRPTRVLTIKRVYDGNSRT